MLNLIVVAFFGVFSREPNYEYMSNDIVKQFSVETLNPKKLRICALGGSSDKGIKTIHIGVNDTGPGSIGDARKLIVSLVLELIYRYNNNIEIRPYLINYPFTDSNFIFDVSYLDPQGGHWVKQEGADANQQLASAMLSRGNIKYYINPKKEMGPLKIVYTESFADALRIVNGDN